MRTTFLVGWLHPWRMTMTTDEQVFFLVALFVLLGYIFGSLVVSQ